MISDDKKRVIITLPKDLLEKIKKLAEKENRSISNYIETVLIEKNSK